jgi:hypothetical protein
MRETFHLFRKTYKKVTSPLAKNGKMIENNNSALKSSGSHYARYKTKKPVSFQIQVF